MRPSESMTQSPPTASRQSTQPSSSSGTQQNENAARTGIKGAGVSVDERESPILYEVDRGVRVVTFNRPDRMNALDTPSVVLHRNMLEKAEAGPQVK